MSMTKTPLTMVRGDSAAFDFTVVHNEQAVDLTSAKVWMTARRKYTTSVVFTKDTGSNGVTIDADQTTNRGKCTVQLSPVDTAALPGEDVTLVYDIQVKTGTTVFTAFMGTIAVEPDVTTATT
jgi:hypothetical protein